MTNLLILFVALLVGAYLTNYFLVHSFLGFRWRIFVAPGVIIHECSHALGCFLTGAKVVKISFFDKDGGSVKHQKPLIPIISPIVISLAPLAVGIACFYFLGKVIHLDSSFNIHAAFSNLKSIYLSIDFGNWKNVLIVYLLLSVAVTMTPSWQDLLNMIFPLIILSGVFYLLLHFNTISASRFDFIPLNLIPILNLAVFIILGLLIISLILYFLTKMLFNR